MASSVEIQRGPAGAMNLHKGDEQQGGVEHVGAVVLDERPAGGVPAALHYLVVDAVADRAPAGMSAGRPRWRATRIARSTATQLISREYVKSRRPPRVSQIPSSGWSQWSISHSRLRVSSIQPS